MLNSEQADRLYHTFQDKETKKPPYAHWQLKLENCVITYYQSGKCLFQGSEAEVYASAFIERPNQPSHKLYPQAGSDEVGTGDYFGPVVVCASYVCENQLDLLRSYGITDSNAAMVYFIVTALISNCGSNCFTSSNEVKRAQLYVNLILRGS